MYTPKHFQMTETEIKTFIKQNAFATLTLIDDGNLIQAAVPLLYLEDTHQFIGHFAGQNAFCAALSVKPTRTVSISIIGADGYIGAGWYPDNEQVPTWNYEMITGKGQITSLDNRDDKLDVLKQMTTHFEVRAGSDWTIDKLPEKKREAMLNAILAFEISDLKLEGKAKLSQNKTEEQRRALIENLPETVEHSLKTRMMASIIEN